MIAGMPGTGIGGLFYFLMALFMPVCELYRTLRGQSSWKRWRFIGLQLFFVVTITGGMVGEVWLLEKLFMWAQQFGQNSAWGQVLVNARMMSFVLPGGAALILAGVIALFFLLRFFVRLNDKSKAVPAANVALRREVA
jgi:hypothetical protein